MAYTVVSALIGSLLLLADAGAAALVRIHAREGVAEEDNLARPHVCKRMYRPLLAGALRQRVRGDWIAVGRRCSRSLALSRRLGSEFLPELNEGSIWVNLMLPAGISLSEASRHAARACGQRCRPLPGSHMP